MAKNPWQQQTTIVTSPDRPAEPTHDFQTITRVLNAIKNRRRIAVLQLLQEKPHSERELQYRLRSMGHRHSLTTIHEYLQPLVQADLVKHKLGKYDLTLRGIGVLELVGKTAFLLKFPRNSSCHEELSLIAIKRGYRTFEELSKIVDDSLLSRTLRRLQKEGLVQSNHPRDHVQFYRVRVRLPRDASPTERRVFHALNQDGISVRDLSKAVGITTRRTYKYLSKLKHKNLVLQRDLPVTYVLTASGRTVADFVEATIARALDMPPKMVLSPDVDPEQSGMRRPLAIVQQYGRNGILQSDLWRRLGLDSRRGSRQILNLEKRGLVERSRELSKGRWTFRIYPRRQAATIDSITGIPCASCEDDFKGACPTHTLNPAMCTRLTHWVVDLDQGMP